MFQQMVAKVSLKHYLFTGRKTSGALPIFLRITYNRKKAELHAGYTSTAKDWNKQDQVTKSNLSINQELAKQKAKLYDLVIELQKKNRPISAAILKDLYTGKNQTQAHLLEYLKAFIEETTIRGQIKAISLNKYRQSAKTLNEFIFAKFGLNDLPIEQVTFEFINGYDLFLKQQYNLHKNTINKYHSRLRTLLLRGLAEGILQKQPYANYKLITTKSDREFLNMDDLTKIIQLDLSHNSSLDKVKDLFIFSCYTGLRFQDAQNLVIENLTTFKNKPFLRYIQEKTGRAVDIPILPVIKKIIEKYKLSSERKVLNKLLPKISNQKVNSYLKVIGELAGLNQSLTHHMARHTFATTICLNNNMALEDVSMLLGHSSLKTTQIYGRITQARLLSSMQKVSKKL